MTRRDLRPRLALLLALATLAPSPASAISSCSFVSVAGPAFGAYDPFATGALDTAGSVTYSCTDVNPGDTVTIDLNRGNAADFSRWMASGVHHLLYNLYLDAAHTLLWGDGTAGTNHLGPVTPPQGSAVIPVYGRIPARQNLPPGSYTDTITVTINF